MILLNCSIGDFSFIFFCYISDLQIKVGGHEICGHCFVFNARSDNWGIKELYGSSSLDLSGNL